MIKINLLSPADKTNARWGKINNLIIFNFLILIIGQFIFVLAFLISIKYLDFENKNLNKQLENMQTQSEIKEIEEIKNNIEKCDKQLKIILELQNSQPNFTEILGKFSEIISDEIKISSINIRPKINKVAKKITKDDQEEDLNDINKFDFEITGQARSRESLLKFENNLRSSEIFLDLIIDLSNYDNKNNNFNYKMTINLN